MTETPRTLAAWAETRGILIVREFIDAGAAAASPDDRSGFADRLESLGWYSFQFRFGGRDVSFRNLPAE